MKIICIGRNYSEHAKELGNAIPEAPVIFMKPSTALLLPGQPFAYPSFTADLHYEVELVYKISKQAKNISEQAAPDYYAEITVGIDFTARDLQGELKQKGLPWEKSKAFDQSAVVGTFVPIQTVADKKTIAFQLKKNGALVQNGNAANMIFNVDFLVAHASQYFTLQPGDLLYTGTPAGVGPAQVGDVFEGFLNNEKLMEVTVQ